MNTVSSEQDELSLNPLLFPLRGERQVTISFPFKKGILAIGDLLLLNAALFLALSVRQFELPGFDRLLQHLFVFNVLHVSWLIIFYSIGLYDIQLFAVPKTIEIKLIQGLGITGLVTIVLFYGLFEDFQPKTILVVDLLFSGVFLLVWRKWFTLHNRNGSRARILLCGRDAEVNQLAGLASFGNHLGYEILQPPVLWGSHNDSPAAMILDRLNREHIDILAITRALSDDSKTRGLSYRLLCAGVPVIEFSHLVEELTGKIPVSAINEEWFIENLREFNKLGFDIFKRCVDVAAAVVLGPLAALLCPLLALTIKLDSAGPVFFCQERTGKGGRVFTLIKFRTMKQNAEAEGAKWASATDNRVTRVGGLLRKTRMDELPQLWNVLKGEMSLVGPRPERPEFVGKLAQDIPFYEARHLVKPGLTGWAQINFGYGASVGDAMEKLQHDLFYIKNRCPALELSIILETVGTVLRYEGR
jgi:exopolysaccharide biosynthesis polyprenyl glycosylphosphotransferase